MFRYQIEGMTCSACSSHVERAVSKLPFVEKAQVSLLSNSMIVQTKDGEPHRQEIEQTVKDAGYKAIAQDQSAGQSAKDKKAPGSASGGQDASLPLRRRFLASLAFLVPLMYLSMHHMFGWPVPKILSAHHYPMVNALAQLLLTTPVMLINKNYFQAGFKRLVSLHPNMDSLIAIGSSAAYAYGIATLLGMAVNYGDGNIEAVHGASMELYFESAVMILTLITLGKFFEARAKKKTTAAIEKLMDLAPDQVTVLREEQEMVLPVAQVVMGDVLLIRPGERIPVDGVLLTEAAALDQSHMTGESVPVDKREGDELIAGSLNKTGSFRMRVTKVGEDTTLAKIVRLVQEAADSKAPISKLADRVSGVFVPVVIAIALVTMAVWLLVGQSFSFALSCAIAVLVISCPCALGLATPVAIMVGTGVGAQNGILFRNGEVLETLHHIGSMVLDKTGTLTEGRMSVQGAYATGDSTREELLQVAMTLEYGSEHPLAEAVREYGKCQGVEAGPMTEFEAVAGKGLSGKINGRVHLAGNQRFMEEKGVSMGGAREAMEYFQAKGYSILCFAKEKTLLGVLGVSDTIKPAAPAAIARLKELNITPYLLTGDQRQAAQAIAQEAGISEVMAEVLPGDKAAKIVQLQQSGQKVAMVGDGINDAPALKQADVGIAVGTGTDIAIETADVVLSSNRLTDLPTAIRLSRAVLTNIKENLFWAFFYNVIGIPIAAGVLYPFFGITLSPMIGAAAMSLSSVFVVGNALRLKRFKADRAAVEETGENSGGQCSLAAMEAARLWEQEKKQRTGERTSPQDMKQEEKTMEKIIHIEGMSCNHCKMAVEKALSALSGVSGAQVDLEKKLARVSGQDLNEQAMKDAVTEAGYEVTGVE